MSLADSSPRAVIARSNRPPEQGYAKTRYRDLDEQVEATVFVQPRTRLPTDEETFALGLTPLRKRRHMTLEQWNEKHGAAKEAIEAVERYARKHGLSVVGEPSVLRRRIGLTGSVGNVNEAFGTRLAHYRMNRDAANRLGYAPTFLGRVGDLSVDVPRIAPLIASVLGLDARPQRSAPEGAPPGRTGRTCPQRRRRTRRGRSPRSTTSRRHWQARGRRSL